MVSASKIGTLTHEVDEHTSSMVSTVIDNDLGDQLNTPTDLLVIVSYRYESWGVM